MKMEMEMKMGDGLDEEEEWGREVVEIGIYRRLFFGGEGAGEIR